MENLPDEKYRYCFEIIGSIVIAAAAAVVWDKVLESITILKNLLIVGNEIYLTASLRRKELPIIESIFK